VHDSALANEKFVPLVQLLHVESPAAAYWPALHPSQSPVIAFGTYPALHELHPALALQSPD
jgi:hypothetical protein